MDFDNSFDIITPDINSYLTIGGTAALVLPVGPTGDRPGSPLVGMIRFNNDTNTFEGYTLSAWGAIGGGGGSANSGPTTLYFDGGSDITVGAIYQISLPANTIITPTINATTSDISGNNTTGMVSTSSINVAGSGYVVANNISTVGGTGYGCTINITGVSGGGISTYTINQPGIGYTANDVLTIAGQASGAQTGSITVNTVTSAVGNDGDAHIIASALVNLTAFYDYTNKQILIYGQADPLEITGTFIVDWSIAGGVGVTGPQGPATIGPQGDQGIQGIQGPAADVLQNSQSAAYTTVLADDGKHIYHPSADTTARIWTIDSNANVPYNIGATISFVNDISAGAITLAITSDTLVFFPTGATGSRTLAAGGIATALKIGTNRWMITGVNLT